MNSMTRTNAARPWYREPWPWFIMAGPALVVVAGVITYVLAARTENALVVDNYYKEGLAINRVLDATRNAAVHRYRARVTVAPDAGARVVLSAEGELAPRLRLQFIHPTHGRMDHTVLVDATGQGEYRSLEGGAQAVAWVGDSPRWYVRLQDEAGSWRLTGEWDVRRGPSVELSTASQ